LTLFERKNRLNPMASSRSSRDLGRRVTTLFVSLLAITVLIGVAPPANAQEDAPTSYLYVTEWQIPHAQWAIWEAYQASTFKPLFEKLMSDHSIESWGFYAQTVHTPDGATHGLWFSASGMAGVEATLNAIGSLPANSVMSNAQVRQRDFLFRSLVSAGRAASGSNGLLWVHRSQSGPFRHEQNSSVWDKYVKPMLDGLVAQGTILSYGIETEQIHTEPDGTYYVYCLMPGANAADKFFAALDALQSKMSTTERNEFNAAQLTGQQERLGHVTFFGLAGAPGEK
jgi:hypothetical protein